MSSAQCSTCGMVAERAWSLPCPNGCGGVLYACMACARSGRAAVGLAEHSRGCELSPNGRPVIDVGAPAPPPPQATPDFHQLHQLGAAAGARAGARRSPQAALAGSVVGAIAGAAAGRVLRRPEVRPIVDVVTGGIKILGDAFAAAREVLGAAPVAAPQEQQIPQEQQFPRGPSTPRR